MKNEKINTQKTDRKFGILAVLGLLVVVAAAVGLLARKSCKDFEKSVVGRTQQHLLTIARTVAKSSEEFIEEHLAVLRVFSWNPSITKEVYSKVPNGKPGIEYCPVRSFYEEHKKHIDAFTVFDDKGIMLERHPFIADRIGMDHTDKPGVSYVIKEHKSHVSKVFVNNLGKTAISISVPVFHNEQFAGIVRCMIQLDTIYKRLVAPIGMGEKGYLQIVNNDGVMAVHPNPEYIGKDIIATRKATFPDYDWSELENIAGKMTKGQEGVGTYHSVWWDADEPKFVKKLTAFTPVKLGRELWSIGVTTDYEEISGPIIVHTRNISMAAGLLILVFSATGLWIYKVQKEKMKLAARAEFAEELRTINQQLTTEITERKQAEEELRIQSDNQKNIFESMEDGVCVIDQQYDVHHINPVLIRDFGAYDGQKCYEYFHNQADVCPWCKNADVFAGKTIRWEWFSSKNGKTYDLIDTPLENPDGSISKLEIFRDITERKQTEEKLQKQHYHLTMAQHAACIGSWDLDIPNNKLFWSDETYHQMGFAPNEIEPTYEVFEKLVHPDDVDMVNQAVRNAIEENKAYSIDARMIRKDGIKWVMHAQGGMVYRDNDDKAGRLVGTQQDITERKRVERGIEESEKRYRALFECAPDGIIVADAETGQYIHVNPSMCKRLGYSEDEIKRLSKFQGIHPKEEMDRIKRLFFMQARGEIDIVEDIPFVKKDGTIRYFDVNSVTVEISGIQRIIGLLRDITDRKRAEEEREKLLKILTAKNAELQSIVYIASHDLRSPLVNVAGFGNELAGDCNKLKELLQDAVFDGDKAKIVNSIIGKSIPESLHFITASAKKMYLLLEGLIQVSRIGTVEVNIGRLDMNKIISHVIETSQFKAKECGAIVTVDQLGNCFGDGVMINQVFSNLIDNALKYLDKKRKGKIHISCRTEDRMNIYCVEDNGIGIEPEHQSKIFEVFHRLEPEDSNGEGLGLTIVTRILGRNDGTIRVESEPEKGSRFFVSLPAANT